MIEIPAGEIRDLALAACLACGAGPGLAHSLVAASLSASHVGRHEVGFAHLLLHLDSLKAGRIIGSAQPVMDSPAPALIRIDAAGGVAQQGFDLAFDTLCTRTRDYGIALLAVRNAYPAGEIGWYARRLAQAGLVALAAANAEALMAVTGRSGKVFSTNPLAFAAPLPGDRPPLVIDQASSATAFVGLSRAAALNERIPEGWALDASGAPTTDAVAALAGALLPFGGWRGANIALMIEILAAGLTGASWSMDVGGFCDGPGPPDSGLLIVALAPALLDPDFETRLAVQLDRLAARGLHIPGARAPRLPPRDSDPIRVAPEVLAALRRYAEGG